MNSNQYNSIERRILKQFASGRSLVDAINNTYTSAMKKAYPGMEVNETIVDVEPTVVKGLFFKRTKVTLFRDGEDFEEPLFVKVYDMTDVDEAMEQFNSDLSEKFKEEEFRRDLIYTVFADLV